ncbi:MAG: DUF1573 domain-containing protein [Proteobacteria bacterium]|nr:DUF1573 domain-containing protein [Pseudomonadota bacterium]MBU1543745.1 DUF1573 domain-containing protein [Pseudomonadota bacterium]MBU2430435.1 DUF1573 domain-containing protein [Pseudomonadota bacterium]MBU2481446.1 DUF1573 domain-containing protein [Pseudomonadota bacterium]
MKLFYVFFVSLFCSIFISTAIADQPPQPKALIDKTDYVFESVIDGTEVTHKFEIKNAGNATLEITKVLTT